jgi:hypothetical protein
VTRKDLTSVAVPVGAHEPTPLAKLVLVVPKVDMRPSYRVEAPAKPLHAALVEPVPCSTFRLMLSARPLVVLYEVPYSLTVEASEPVEVTLMHLVPVAPGLRLLAVNSAVSLSSSLSATVPAVQLLVGLTVVAENAEYDAAGGEQCGGSGSGGHEALLVDVSQ